MPQHAPQLRDTSTASPTVAIKLHGKHGRGRNMIMDKIDWSRVRLVLGERWNVGRAGAFEYVVAYGGKAAKLTPGNQPLILARWLMWAERTDAVLYRDRDPLNLTRGNLEVIGRLDLPERMRSRRGMTGSEGIELPSHGLTRQPGINSTAQAN